MNQCFCIIHNWKWKTLSMRSFNTIKVVDELIRKRMLEENFNLKDTFCDAEQFKHSWKARRLPQTVCAFFSVLLNINQTKVMSILEYNEYVLDVNDIENDERAKDKGCGAGNRP